MNRFLCIYALGAAVAAASPSDYVNFVRQVQQDTGVEWDVSVAPSGSMLSPEGVGKNGSLFQLWSLHALTAFEFLLDEEFVSAFTPSAAITIQTGDPYEHVARTRVDQPFAVRIHISGLLNKNDAPPSAKQVLLRHASGTYPEGEHVFPADSQDNHATVGAAMITWNGEFVLNYGFTSLRGPDLTKIEGEEVWSVSALDGGTGGVPLTEGEVLESARLQIWPIADATISGIDTVKKYENLPPITVNLNDLYPDSTTNLRVYFGPPSANPSEAANIQTSYVIIQDSIPQNRVLNLDNLDHYFTKHGAYTLEVVHQTPFGTEVLNQFYPLNIKRGVAIRGSVYSAD